MTAEIQNLSYLIEKTIEEDFGISGLLWDEDQAILILSDLFETRGTRIVVIGKTGSGKTAWAIRAAELAKEYFGRSAATLMLEYEGLKTYYDMREVPNGTFLVVDEAELIYHARRSQRRENVSLSLLLSLSRHKRLTLVFVTQSTNLIDKAILSAATHLVVKEPSLFSLSLERYGFFYLVSYAKSFFATLPEGMRRQVYLVQSDYVYNWLYRRFAHYTRYFPRYYVEAVIRQYSIIKAKNRLPKYWSDEISTAYADYDVFAGRQVKGLLSQLPDKFTPDQVAEALNVSRTTAYRLIKRWRDAKLIKKVKKGVYAKIKNA